VITSFSGPASTAIDVTPASAQLPVVAEATHDPSLVTVIGRLRAPTPLSATVMRVPSAEMPKLRMLASLVLVSV